MIKTIILAGGRGSRLSEETIVRPKPLVEIGGKPILWHLMQIYSQAGFTEFLVALGYKGEMIKEYFLNFHALSGDLSLDLTTGKQEIHGAQAPEWKVHLIDTGVQTQTGGRLRRLREWVKDDIFMMTYGDGMADVNVRQIVDFHRQHGRWATMTLVRPPSRFGAVVCEGDRVVFFEEKPVRGEGWINGGFFVLHPKALDYIEGDATIWEQQPLEGLARDGQLMAYHHDGFFQPMDTLREKQILEALWQSGDPPWMRGGGGGLPTAR